MCDALVAAARALVPDSLQSADDATLVLVHLPTRVADHVRLATSHRRRLQFPEDDEQTATS